MPIKWNLKRFLATKYQIYSVKELQKRITKQTGIIISHSNLCKLVNKEPTLLSVRTAEIICSTLQCELSEFLVITPKNFNKKNKVTKLSPINTPITKLLKVEFPEPDNYSERS